MTDVVATLHVWRNNVYHISAFFHRIREFFSVCSSKQFTGMKIIYNFDLIMVIARSWSLLHLHHSPTICHLKFRLFPKYDCVYIATCVCVFLVANCCYQISKINEMCFCELSFEYFRKRLNIWNPIKLNIEFEASLLWETNWSWCFFLLQSFQQQKVPNHNGCWWMFKNEKSPQACYCEPLHWMTIDSARKTHLLVNQILLITYIISMRSQIRLELDSNEPENMRIR